MKKLLGIIVLSLLWYNFVLADVYELKIDLDTSEKTSKKIIIKDGYSSECRASLKDSNAHSIVDFNFYAINSELKTEIGFYLKEQNETVGFNVTHLTQINQNGTMGKTKFLSEEWVGKPEEQAQLKKALKPYLIGFKQAGKIMFDKDNRRPEYGKSLKWGSMGKVNYDPKKSLNSLISLASKMVPSNQRGQLKKIFNYVKKNSNMTLSKEYIGHSVIEGQKYYLIRYNFIIDYTGDNYQYESFMKQWYFDQIIFVHAESGMPTIIYDIKPNTDTLLNHRMNCKVFKNKVLISEISVPKLLKN
mgnify:FL=1